MVKIPGIQIIGTQRSGSNLLRVILDQSNEISSPHPPHILVVFTPLLPLYGPLDAWAYRLLIEDVVEYVKVNPVPWEGVELDAADIFEKSETYSLIELNKLIYQAAASAKHAKYWCCKSMANVHYAKELEDANLGLKYVYLYRDGRDVAASFKKAVVGEKHVFHLANQWKKDQEACLELEQKVGPDRFYKLNYETLIAAPEMTVRKLCSFLNINYSEDMLSFYTSRNSKLTAEAGEMWGNLKKPIINDNTGTYLKVFKDDDLPIFEAVAGEVLVRLGYPLRSEKVDSNDDLYSKENLIKYDCINADLKKLVLQSAKTEDLENRKPQEDIIAQIKNRITQS
jgi:hypothetical protein